MSLGVTDKVARQIADDPNFKGRTAPSTAFFRQILRQNGYSGDIYIHTRTARHRPASSPTASAAASMAPCSSSATSTTRARAVDYVVLTTASLGEHRDPDEGDARLYYETRRPPSALRNIAASYLLLEAKSIAKAGEVTDADARDRYDSQKSKYSTPEKRRVLQLLFNDNAEAEAAAAELAAGKTFADLLAARNLKEADVDLGLVVRDKLIDRPSPRPLSPSPPTLRAPLSRAALDPSSRQCDDDRARRPAVRGGRRRHPQ
ncbi:MAG: peptidylprolyl isomerase [Hyphomicrobiales bacterium]